MKKTIIYLISAFLLLETVTLPHTVQASTVYASSAAFRKDAQVVPVDYRAQILSDYLKSKNSPLSDSAQTFVSEADKYNLDWKLVAAISGLESGFGKEIPYNSYNGWGWGVYGDNVMYFSSWDDAIATISQGLRQNYLDKGATDIYSIGHIYAASPTWAQRVTAIMANIDTFAQNWSPEPRLSLSL